MLSLFLCVGFRRGDIFLPKKANIVKILLKRFGTAGTNFLQPLSTWAQQTRKIDTSST